MRSAVGVSLAVALAAFVLGTTFYRSLPVGQDAGFGVLLVAIVFGVAAAATFAWREARRGTPIARAITRSVVLAALTVAFAMLPVAAFVAYCFTPLNPDAPCLR